MTHTLSNRPLTVIEPVRGWRNLRLRDLWEFRDLLTALGMRDIKLVYKQTLLGITWVILQPLIGAGIFSFVFGLLADMPSGDTPYFVFSFAGMLGWTLFSSALTQSSLVMINNAHLVSKIYFPRLILPLSSAFQPVVNFAVGLLMMLLLLVLYRVPLGLHLLWIPMTAMPLLMLAVGIGFWCGSIMVRYRDLRFIIPVATQFLLYASPVGYGLSALQDKIPQRYEVWYMLNPLASQIELFRWSVLGDGRLSLTWLFYSLTLSLGVFISGAFAFRRAEQNFADTI